MKNITEMRLDELAERSGVPARTIRLYISKGLLPGPLRAGRNASYGAEHLERLGRIRQFQEQGLTLGQMGRVLEGPGKAAQLPPPTAWHQFALSDEVQVSVRGGLPPWRMKVICDAIAELNARLGDAANTEDDHG